ncbi:unnamed protein product [Amoebophrya sp. A25]|nr:unnamed protein product [Amoebophrya sp. A25]|eukprot:GSA25T00019504001.1
MSVAALRMDDEVGTSLMMTGALSGASGRLHGRSPWASCLRALEKGAAMQQVGASSSKTASSINDIQNESAEKTYHDLLFGDANDVSGAPAVPANEHQAGDVLGGPSKNNTEPSSSSTSTRDRDAERELSSGVPRFFPRQAPVLPEEPVNMSSTESALQAQDEEMFPTLQAGNTTSADPASYDGAALVDDLMRLEPSVNKDHHNRVPKGVIHKILTRIARTKMLQRKLASLVVEPDLHKLLEPLRAKAILTCSNYSEREVIDYKTFREVYRLLLEEYPAEEREIYQKRFGPFFTARSYLKFGSLVSEIGIVPFFSYVVRMVNTAQTRIQLSYYDTLGSGYLREKDVENFIFELIPTLPQLQQLQEEFYPFYVFTAVRKFFFLLDPKRTGKIHIRRLLPSTLLPELYELRAETKGDVATGEGNWFSVESALRVYGMYLELDSDQNGMLSPAELVKYGSGLLSEEIIIRVFEEYQTYRDETGAQEMDYKTFLDFVLAMKNKHCKQSIYYMWRLIDLNHDNQVTKPIIRYFLQGIRRNMDRADVPHDLLNSSSVDIDDVVDEIFDMIRPTNPCYITVEDVLESKMGVTMLSILTDTQAFFHYDQREHLLAPDEEGADEMGS